MLLLLMLVLRATARRSCLCSQPSAAAARSVPPHTTPVAVLLGLVSLH